MPTFVIHKTWLQAYATQNKRYAPNVFVFLGFFFCDKVHQRSNEGHSNLLLVCQIPPLVFADQGLHCSPFIQLSLD